MDHVIIGETVVWFGDEACALSSRPAGVMCGSSDGVEVIEYLSFGQLFSAPACAECRNKMLTDFTPAWSA